MNWIIEFIKRLHCQHDYRFRFNYYGDAIRYNGWNRSAWECVKCRNWIARKEFVDEEAQK